MKRWWLRYLAIGLAVYAVVLIVKLPAAVAYPYIQGALQPLAMTGLEGTIWSGQAASVVYQREAIGSVSWSLRPWALLAGELGAALQVDGPVGEVRGVAGIGLGGNGFVEDLTGSLSAAALAPLLRLQAVRPQGRVELDIARLGLRGRIPVQAEGVVTWREARVSAPRPLDLGSFSATLTTDAEGVSAALRDQDSPLVLDAVLALTNDGSYRVTGRLSAKNEAPAELHNLLRGAGVRQQGGALPLNITGRLR